MMPGVVALAKLFFMQVPQMHHSRSPVATQLMITAVQILDTKDPQKSFNFSFRGIYLHASAIV